MWYIDEDEIGEGLFRDLTTYAPRLAQFYLTVNENRLDKLKEFKVYHKTDASSFLFLLAIGGAETPVAGTSFLLSFLNTGERIASSFEHFLIFGENVKKNVHIISRYIARLMDELKYRESKVFSFEVAGKYIPVEF